MKLNGRVQDLQGDLYHFSYRDLSDHFQRINSYTNVASKEKYKRHVRFPLARMLIQPPFKFFKIYFFKQGFREGVPGLIIAILGMFYVFLKYAKLWELRLHEKKNNSRSSFKKSFTLFPQQKQMNGFLKRQKKGFLFCIKTSYETAVSESFLETWRWMRAGTRYKNAGESHWEEIGSFRRESPFM